MPSQSVLVVAEHDNRILKPSTIHTLGAALQLNAPVEVLVMGADCRAVADSVAQYPGVVNVLWCDHPDWEHPMAEHIAAVVLAAHQKKAYQAILAPATTFGKNCLPRVAARLDVAQISDIIQVVDARTFVRPIYAGNALETVQSDDPVQVVTVRATHFSPPLVTDARAPVVAWEHAPAAHPHHARFVKQEHTVTERPELTSASVVISGGRGLQSKENFKLLEDLADKLGAAIGASRAAVDAGFAPNDYQVGQTGKIVAPKLYIAVGISGAIQHLAGMKDSQVIVAINKDPDAPIFQYANYSLVGDLFQILPELSKALSG